MQEKFSLENEGNSPRSQLPSFFLFSTRRNIFVYFPRLSISPFSFQLSAYFFWLILISFLKYRQSQLLISIRIWLGYAAEEKNSWVVKWREKIVEMVMLEGMIVVVKILSLKTVLFSVLQQHYWNSIQMKRGKNEEKEGERVRPHAWKKIQREDMKAKNYRIYSSYFFCSDMIHCKFCAASCSALLKIAHIYVHISTCNINEWEQVGIKYFHDISLFRMVFICICALKF